MKITRQLNLMAMLLLSFTAQAQDFYYKFLEDGKRWVLVGDGDECQCAYEYVVDGDTIVHGIECKVLRYSGDSPRSKPSGCVLYEKDKQVYKLMPDGEFCLLYDFGKEVGDTILQKDIDDYVETWRVERVDTTEAFGIYYRRLDVISEIKEKATDRLLEERTKQARWVSGVGGITYPGDSFGGRYDYFMSFEYCLYGNQGFIPMTVFNRDPVHFTTVNAVKYNNNTSSPVFDLQGRRVANPQKGIYVRNGKKVVVK